MRSDGVVCSCGCSVAPAAGCSLAGLRALRAMPAESGWIGAALRESGASRARALAPRGQAAPGRTRHSCAAASSACTDVHASPPCTQRKLDIEQDIGKRSMSPAAMLGVASLLEVLWVAS